MARLIGVEDVARVEGCLAELALEKTEGILESFRLRREGLPLPEQAWSELIASLSMQSGEAPERRLAKECLALALWRVEEPSSVAPFLDNAFTLRPE